MNECIFIGRVTNDLELVTSKSGTEILNFDIAVQRSYKNNDGEYESDFIRCIAFKKTAEFLSKYAKKGYVVSVKGEMRNNNFTRDDGTTNYGMQLLINSVDPAVIFLNKKSNQEDELNSYKPPSTSRGQNNNYNPPAGSTNNPFSSGAIDIQDDDLPF